jgi:hypothetical protein
MIPILNLIKKVFSPKKKIEEEVIINPPLPVYKKIFFLIQSNGTVYYTCEGKEMTISGEKMLIKGVAGIESELIEFFGTKYLTLQNIDSFNINEFMKYYASNY